MKLNVRKLIVVTSILLLVVAGLCSCVRPKRSPVYVNADLRSYFGYEPGSYWVFYDSLHNTTDSLYVVNKIDHAPYYDGRSPNEVIEIYMINSPDNLSWMLSLGAASTTMTVSDPNNPSRGVVADPLTNNWPFDQGTTHSSFDSSTYECTFFPTAIVNTVAYNNVYKVVNTKKTGSDTYYFNADNGFTGIQLNGAFYQKNLALVRYKVVR